MKDAKILWYLFISFQKMFVFNTERTDLEIAKKTWRRKVGALQLTSRWLCFIYRICFIWTPLLSQPHTQEIMLKCNFYAFFMWQHEVKNLFWKIEPRGSNTADTARKTAPSAVVISVLRASNSRMKNLNVGMPIQNTFPNFEFKLQTR